MAHTQRLTQDSSGCRWALPEGMEVPLDPLLYRIDVHKEAILLHHFDGEETVTRVVSALDIARAFTRELRLGSSLLPEGALWWSMGPEGNEIALWRGPQVWRVAVRVLLNGNIMAANYMRLPMPGLIFVCAPGRAPRVFAATRRPRSPDDQLYHAPLFNVFQDGRSCAGTHQYPQRVEEIPESFFSSYFTREGHTEGRSKKHPHDLMALWEELDGKRRFPVRDLVPLGTVEQVMGLK